MEKKHTGRQAIKAIKSILNVMTVKLNTIHKRMTKYRVMFAIVKVAFGQDLVGHRFGWTDFIRHLNQINMEN